MDITYTDDAGETLHLSGEDFAVFVLPVMVAMQCHEHGLPPLPHVQLAPCFAGSRLAKAPRLWSRPDGKLWLEGAGPVRGLFHLPPAGMVIVDTEDEQIYALAADEFGSQIRPLEGYNAVL